MRCKKILSRWNNHYSKEVSVFSEVWNRLVKLKNDGRIIIINPILGEIEPISSGDKKHKDADQLREKHPLRKWF